MKKNKGVIVLASSTHRRWRISPEKRIKWIENLRRASLESWRSGSHSMEGYDENWRNKISEGLVRAWNNSEIKRRYKTAAGRGVITIEAKKKSSESHKKYRYPGLKCNRMMEWKKRCIEYAGVYCKKCGISCLDIRADFHHINTQDEDCFNILAVGGCDNRDWDEYKKEIDKCLLLCVRCHTKIHRLAYNYLVKINKHGWYIKWFLEKKELRTFKDYCEEFKVHKHHIDLDHRNSKEENLLFLKHEDHISLHMNAYLYLVYIDQIQNYLDWFLKE